MKCNQLFLIGMFILTTICLFSEDLEFRLVKGGLGLRIERLMTNNTDKVIFAPSFEKTGRGNIIIFATENGGIISNWNNFIPKPREDAATNRTWGQLFSPKNENHYGFWDPRYSNPSVDQNGKYYVLGLMKALIDEKSKKSILKRSSILHVIFQNGKILDASEIKEESLPKEISTAIEKEIAKVILDEGL